MKAESKLWHLLKKNTPKISWTRLESWASFGVPDLLGYQDACGFFMVELKVTKTHKVSFSPHQKLFHMTRTNRNFILLQDTSLGVIKLYGSKSIHGLLLDHRDTPSLTNNDWEHVQRLLVREPLDAWALAGLSACTLVGLWPCALARLRACAYPFLTAHSSWICMTVGCLALCLVFGIFYVRNLPVPASSTATTFAALLWSGTSPAPIFHRWRPRPESNRWLINHMWRHPDN